MWRADTYRYAADRQVYKPGDLVQVNVVTTATGQLAVETHGYSTTLQLPITSFQFNLPAVLARGTYEILYTLTDCNCPLDNQTRAYRFDVDAPEIRVTDAQTVLADMLYPTSSLKSPTHHLLQRFSQRPCAILDHLTRRSIGRSHRTSY